MGMAMSRKRKADTVLVGFMGMPVASTGPNQHSCQSVRPEVLSLALELAPTLPAVMRRAGASECTHAHSDWCDASEAQSLAEESERKSRLFLSERGWLP